MPAYVVAYTYTGLTDFAGPLQSALRSLFGWHSARDYWFPELRSLGGEDYREALLGYYSRYGMGPYW